MKSYRSVLAAVFLLAAATTVGSFFAQYVMGLNPCPLCILQRVAVIAVLAVSALCLLLPAAKPAGRTAAALLVSLPAAWGLYTAVYQTLAAKPARNRTTELRRTLDLPPERMAAVRLVAVRRRRLWQLRRARIRVGRAPARMERAVLLRRAAAGVGYVVQNAAAAERLRPSEPRFGAAETGVPKNKNCFSDGLSIKMARIFVRKNTMAKLPGGLGRGLDSLLPAA